MTTCPVCNSTDSWSPVALFSDTHYRLEFCSGCGRILSMRVLESAEPLPSAEEMVETAEAIVRGRT